VEGAPPLAAFRGSVSHHGVIVLVIEPRSSADGTLL
jgi:hypothetical protein